ncbi:dTDP-glucose pyrophosphorylase [Clostridium tetanomorphum]|uniref:nucleotidyltransferase family protein n=1 Tax=Clostridium tetanomorphum TaxID=1553 RepID=UPI0004499415|nr:nucleotidyltransferase family protein [Clostridium tetanomorphum]KAJ52335.1 nucleotidyl transferase [Clostridium tetanomorphum DSM 665]MBP1865256.1 dTDP-glucose pyrophosphorylase [Clostridium tetanomorphum]NRS85179.1 dTDP-glucose pyrophosphorylase [Clostridium tetanomorphum]SQC03112.1 nucleotidyl transferase [Clostridium tetanomorphum]
MRTNLRQLLINKNYSIKCVLQVIDKGSEGIVLVVDNDEKLIGTITDGDIRRALIKGYKLENSVEKIINYNPIYATMHMSKNEIKEILIKNAIKDIPIIDEGGRVVDLISIRDILLPDGKQNSVVIMAGGLGTRLKDLTREIPKPMLKVGEDPMLQHIINNFKQYGYNNILISVNYKAEIIENYFQDGFAYGVKISYIKENKRLGTAGGIKLAEDYLHKPFFVINGDVFTNLNVQNMMDFHMNNEFDITVGVRKYTFRIPYGVLDVENNFINSVKEKPVIDYLINGGVYCINPNLIKYIPQDTYFEITDLINICIKNGLKVGSYEIKEYWMDIGKIEDYNKVNEDVYDLVCCGKVGKEDDK